MVPVYIYDKIDLKFESNSYKICKGYKERTRFISIFHSIYMNFACSLICLVLFIKRIVYGGFPAKWENRLDFAIFRNPCVEKMQKISI